MPLNSDLLRINLHKTNTTQPKEPSRAGLKVIRLPPNCLSKHTAVSIMYLPSDNK